MQPVKNDFHDWDVSAAPALISTKNGPPFIAAGAKDGYVYGIDRNGIRATAGAEPDPGRAGDAWKAMDHPELAFGQFDSSDRWKGWVTAADPETGEVRWRVQTPTPMVAAITATAGGVVFTGDLDGNVLAYDAHDAAASVMTARATKRVDRTATHAGRSGRAGRDGTERRRATSINSAVSATSVSLDCPPPEDETRQRSIAAERRQRVECGGAPRWNQDGTQSGSQQQ